MKILDKITELLGGNNSKNVRIEKIKPFQVENEIPIDTVWFENRNIKNCIRAKEKLK